MARHNLRQQYVIFFVYKYSTPYDIGLNRLIDSRKPPVGDMSGRLQDFPVQVYEHQWESRISEKSN
jgi:hypothetical protein